MHIEETEKERKRDLSHSQGIRGPGKRSEESWEHRQYIYPAHTALDIGVLRVLGAFPGSVWVFCFLFFPHLPTALEHFWPPCHTPQLSRAPGALLPQHDSFPKHGSNFPYPQWRRPYFSFSLPSILIALERNYDDCIYYTLIFSVVRPWKYQIYSIYLMFLCLFKSKNAVEQFRATDLVYG